MELWHDSVYGILKSPPPWEETSRFKAKEIGRRNALAWNAKQFAKIINKCMSMILSVCHFGFACTSLLVPINGYLKKQYWNGTNT